MIHSKELTVKVYFIEKCLAKLISYNQMYKMVLTLTDNYCSTYDII
jgi:hypothetical protein